MNQLSVKTHSDQNVGFGVFNLYLWYFSENEGHLWRQLSSKLQFFLQIKGYFPYSSFFSPFVSLRRLEVCSLQSTLIKTWHRILPFAAKYSDSVINFRLIVTSATILHFNFSVWTLLGKNKTYLEYFRMIAFSFSSVMVKTIPHINYCCSWQKKLMFAIFFIHLCVADLFIYLFIWFDIRVYIGYLATCQTGL